MNPYSVYCPSGVKWLGDVPEHWKVRPLIRSVSRADERVESGEASGLPCVGLEHVESWTGRLLPLDDQVTPESISNNFNPGNVLFGKLRPYLAKAFCPEFKGLCSTEFLVLNPLDYDRRYLLYLMLTDGFVSLVDSSTYGAKMPRANWEFVSSCLLPLPPLNEQEAIADYLDRKTERIDALVAKSRLLIEHLDEYRAALITRTVTRGLPPEAACTVGLDPSPRLKPSGITWLGDVPEHWEVIQPSYGFGQIGSGTTPASEVADYYEGTTPWVTTSELRENTIYETVKSVSEEALHAYSALKVFPEGSLVIAMYGATIGRLGFLGVPATVNQACCVFAQPTRLTGMFVYFWLRAFRDILISHSVGGGQPNLNQELLRSLQIPAPDVREQACIGKFLEQENAQIDALVSSVVAAIKRLQEYRAALITAAVTGKFDVRETISGLAHPAGKIPSCE